MEQLKMEVIRILNNDLSVLIGKSNSGKSMLLAQLIKSYKEQYKGEVYAYGLRDEVVNKLKIRTFSSLIELENIKNAIVIIDEMGSIFDLEDRKQRKQIESILRLVNHNGNKILLSGTPNNFKKFICAKAKCFCFKGLNITDLINGSLAKEIVNQYRGDEKGLFSLQIPENEVLCFDQTFFKMKVDYNKDFDTKLENVNLFVQKKY